ncbi:unnamed protein product [Nezara viridula]|uniref:Translation initiation factor eIF2B subunit epsilon n=1 Tax=Nezara viridula TaxID=85310 RepID=A0A9P0H307_NEZVI|nr:unnamed protein product [Nezara viridula]
MHKKTGRSVVDSVTKEDVIQAVLIADSYNDDLFPAYPVPCLLPIVNLPLLDYTLQCLSSAHVQEVIIFCSAHADSLKEYLKGKCWGRMSINVVVSDGCRSLGDAMRDLDSKALIRGDFILLTGNLIGNLKVLPALEKHKKIQKTDKGLAMTLLYKECGKKSRTEDDEVFLAIDKNTSQLLLHQRCSREASKINLPVEKLLEHKSMDIRCDLMDTRVAICSLSVPPLFSDNFDYQTRDDFVRGLLMDEEILASSVYTYILPPTEYAASVTSWQNYHSISHDIIHRWTYPLVPDMFLDQYYSYRRNNIYVQDNVTLAQGCSLVEDVVIGGESDVGENTVIQSSIIGKNCKISEKSSIINSHILNRVTIEKGCKIDYCVIGEGCIIRNGAQLTSCIIGPGVVIGRDKVVENMRLQSERPLGEDEKENYGPKAFVYQSEETEAGSDSDSDIYPIAKKYYGLKLEARADDSDTCSESEGHISDKESLLQEDTNVFFSEVVDSLLRGYEDKLPCDNLVLEVNSSRYAYNVTLNEVNYYVVRAILTLQDEFKWDGIAAKLKYFMPLLVNYIRNEEAMLDSLNAIEDVAEVHSDFEAVSLKLIHLLYNKDILSEDAILKWYNEPRMENEESKRLRKVVEPFIKWLKEADDEESESE